MANYKAHFRTALGQREIVLDTKVTADLVVGQICKFTPGTDDNPGTLVASTAPAADGDYIIAQSDMTMEYGHVPVEYQDYRYNPKVAATTGDEWKKVAVFRVIDVTDVYSVEM